MRNILLAFLLAISIQLTQPAYAYAPSNEGEYYRGIYDLCLYLGKKYTEHSEATLAKSCFTFVGEVVKNEWYESPSKGWHWPLK